jgi:hypothetical protein
METETITYDGEEGGHLGACPSEIEEITPDDLTDEQKKLALVYYAKQLTRLKKFNKTHKEQINESAKKYYKAIRQDPVKNEAFKQKRREKYSLKNQP